jgi:hypothetical protein
MIMNIIKNYQYFTAATIIEQIIQVRTHELSKWKHAQSNTDVVCCIEFPNEILFTWMQ